MIPIFQKKPKPKWFDLVQDMFYTAGSLDYVLCYSVFSEILCPFIMIFREHFLLKEARLLFYFLNDFVSNFRWYIPVNMIANDMHVKI